MFLGESFADIQQLRFGSRGVLLSLLDSLSQHLHLPVQLFRRRFDTRQPGLHASQLFRNAVNFKLMATSFLLQLLLEVRLLRFEVLDSVR